ncbi:Hsp20/alpha crystallin family protein [bacterium]|nr:Hsp20/alpha crystallin family protein [bacterium]
MKSDSSVSKKSIMIFAAVCIILWSAVFFIIGRLNNKKESDTSTGFDKLIIPTDITGNMEIDNASIDINSAIADILSVTEQINDQIKGNEIQKSAQTDVMLKMVIDEDDNNYIVILDLKKEDLDNISFEVNGVTLVVEQVFMNMLTGKPDLMKHYTLELPGPVNYEKAKMRYEQGHILIILPKA